MNGKKGRKNKLLNKIFNEDCTETMKRIPDEYIDLVVTSPPYDNLRDYKGYFFDFRPIARQLYRIIKTGGVVVWVVGDATVDGSETGTSFKQALWFVHCGFKLHDTMIYEKAGLSFPDTNRYYQAFEYMFVFSKGTPKTVNLLCDRKNIEYGNISKGGQRQKDGSLRQRRAKPVKELGVRFNIWRMTNSYKHGCKENYAYQHPARFPEHLAKDHILSWSNEGDIVYDPFMGSGTTAKMAKLTNRHYIGSEISAEYCEIAERRVRETHVQLKLLTA